MIKSLSRQYMFLLLIAVTLSMYCSSLIEITLKPAVAGLDDGALLQQLLNYKLTLHDVFGLQNSSKYYRPFLVLTFLIDQKLWGETIFGYRLTNVVLHACNTVIVFALVSILFKSRSDRDRISFFAALMFAVHPLAVESVSWISGRTDLLATFFALLAFYLYLAASEKNRIYLFLFSFFCALAAALSKETGITIFIIIMGWEIYYGKFFDFSKAKHAALFMLLLLGGGLLYFVLRLNALAASDMSMEIIRSRISSGEISSSAVTFCSSYGFYIKKFFFPFPLQFAIDRINIHIYAVLGIVMALLFGITFFLKSGSRYNFFYFWTLLGLLPAAIVSLTDIAWTRWAERYLYFSSVPLSIMAGLLFSSLKERYQLKYQTAADVLVLGIFVIFAVASYQRSMLWNDDFLLWKDTHEKAPIFIAPLVEYADAYAAKGNTQEAENLLNKAKLLSGSKHKLFLSLGHLSRIKGRYGEAKDLYLAALYEAKQDGSLVMTGPYWRRQIWSSLSQLEMQQANNSRQKKNIRVHQKKAVEYLVTALNEDPSEVFLRYNIAKLYLFLGKKREAEEYFADFIQSWPDDFYRQSAIKLLEKARKKT